MSSETPQGPSTRLTFTFNLGALPPKVEATEQQEKKLQKEWKRERLKRTISDFLEQKGEISPHLWGVLKRYHVVSSEDSPSYIQNWNNQEFKDYVSDFHQALTPFVQLLQKHEGKLPENLYPQEYVRFTLPSTSRQVEN